MAMARWKAQADRQWLEGKAGEGVQVIIAENGAWMQ